MDSDEKVPDNENDDGDVDGEIDNGEKWKVFTIIWDTVLLVLSVVVSIALFSALMLYLGFNQQYLLNCSPDDWTNCHA